MSDVRLTATNPADSSVIPVACNARGELMTVAPVIEAIPNDVEIEGDLTVTGTINGDLGPVLPEPYGPENSVLGIQNGEPAWIENYDPTPPDTGVLVATTFNNGRSSIDGAETSGYTGYGVCTIPQGFTGFYCVAFSITNPSPYAGVFVREVNGEYKSQDAKDQTLCSSIGTMNRSPDWSTLSAYKGFATASGVQESKTAISVGITKDFSSGLYMWVIDCTRRQLFIGETLGQGRWIDDKRPGMAQGVASFDNSDLEVCLSPYNATLSLVDAEPPEIVGRRYEPRVKYYQNKVITTSDIDLPRRRRD